MGVKFLARSTTLGVANTPVSLRALIDALSPAWGSANLRAFSALVVADDGSAGNLVMTDNSAAASEAGGVNLTTIGNAGFGPLSYTLPSANPDEIYLISATLNKGLSIIGVTKF